MEYSDAPFRNSTLEIVTSANSIGRTPSELSIVSDTSARPSGALVEVPAKMTSSILPPRSVLAPCSPMTQASASTTFDLPEPFGPTTQVIPGSRARVVDWAKDLKPFRVMLFRCKLNHPFPVPIQTSRARSLAIYCRANPGGLPIGAKRLFL